MAVTEADIQALATSEDDFRHELLIGKTMRAFRANGLEQIEHGGAYNDPLTGKPRQFDYRAVIRRGESEIRLAVEGKRINPAAPIIVCGVARNDAEAVHDLIVSGTRAHGHAPYCQIDRRKSDLYFTGGFVGKNVFRAKTDKGDKGTLKKEGDGEIFERYAQALSSSVELTRRACAAAIHREECPCVVRSAILPIVVVPDGTLWEVEARSPVTGPEISTEAEE